MDNKALADLLVPDVKYGIDYYEKLYPSRNLPDGAKVTRYAPSPTGFQHLGGVFAAIIAERLAHQSGGVVYLRIEDTDRKREIEGGGREIVRAMKTYDIYFDEGLNEDGAEIGNYGPYKQSGREEIYKTYVKYMIEKGYAYPCFCTEKELEATRNEQEAQKARTGYYGKWARCSELSLDEIREKLSRGGKYIIRLRATGDWDKKIVFKDLIKGRIEFPENDQHIVILKSDGLPTYHFAHAVDDHLMGTTHVTRGVEWLPSLPIHIQLFELLGFKLPKFAHISPVLKMDGTSKRKLSKRKDPEISFSYYEELGYPKDSIIEYLLSIINSNFEEWRRDNPSASYRDFPVTFDKISPGGPLFDTNKLMDISRNVIALMSPEEVCSLYLQWAGRYDEEMAQIIEKDRDYALKIFSIDRDIPKPRKDYAKWQDVKEKIEYFYDELFYKDTQKDCPVPERISPQEAASILGEYLKIYNHEDDKTKWFERIGDMSERLGYSKDMKAYRKNPENYKGNVGDISMVIRIAVTNKTNTPDLYEIMQIIGQGRVVKRIKDAAERYSK